MIAVDTSAFRAALGPLLQRIRAGISAGLDAVAAEGLSSAKGTTRFKDKSGALRQSLQVQVLPGFKRALVTGPLKQAIYCEFGNRPGGVGDRIFPKHAKFLRFEIGGQVFYRRSVKAHGPLPFMGDARAVMVQRAPDVMVLSIARAIR